MLKSTPRGGRGHTANGSSTMGRGVKKLHRTTDLKGYEAEAYALSYLLGNTCNRR
jgi:hypothetical protein